MKYKVIITHRFKKSLKKIVKSGNFNLDKYHTVTDILETGQTLPHKYYDHSLQGNWAGYRECHIESNVLLIYEVDEDINSITLVDIGSHPYLFGS